MVDMLLVISLISCPLHPGMCISTYQCTIQATMELQLLTAALQCIELFELFPYNAGLQQQTLICISKPPSLTNPLPLYTIYQIIIFLSDNAIMNM